MPPFRARPVCPEQSRNFSIFDQQVICPGIIMHLFQRMRGALRGRRRIRTCPSVTLTMAPFSRASRCSVIIPFRKRFTFLGFIFRRRKIITLGILAPLAAMSSPKSRSCVKRIRPSFRAICRTAGSVERSDSRSCKWIVSYPRLRRKSAVLGEIPMSSRNFIWKLALENGHHPQRARQHIGVPAECLLVPNMGRIP